MRGLVVLAFCLLATASTARAEQVKLSLWTAYTGAEEASLKRAVRAFEQAHPGVTVDVLALPFGAYASKLESAIPTGRGPDVFIDAHERLPTYVRRGLLAPLANSPSDAPHRATLSVEGKVYGAALRAKAAALFVNTELAPFPVASLDDLAALRTRLPEGAYPLVFEADNPYYLSALLHAEGGALITEDGSYGFIGPAAERALERVSKWADEGVIPREASGDLVKRLFAGGQAAALIGGPWIAADLPASLSYRVQQLPAPLAPLVTVEAALLARPHSAARARWAEQLAQHLAETARRDTTDDPAFAAAAAAGVPMSTHANMRAVWEPAARAAKKAARDPEALQAALSEGQRRFLDAIRPLPERRDPTLALVGVGLVLLVIAVHLVRRASDPSVRAAFRQSLPAYRYVAHAALAVVLLVIGPLAVGAITSLFSGTGFDLYYVGLHNYVEILTARGGDLLGSGSFWLVLLVTVLWTVSNLALHLGIGLGLALLLNRLGVARSRMYRVLLILPWAVPSYVTALCWKGMFHQQFGAVNALITALGGEPVSWFARWSTAFCANLATNVWLGFPFMMVVTLGALTAIPADLYEAADVDGATARQKLRLITLPMIRPVLAPAVAMGAVWTFNMFNVVFLVSGGEPDGGTEILVSEAYRWAFTRSSQYGYAAAYAVLIFGILWLATRLSPRPQEAA